MANLPTKADTSTLTVTRQSTDVPNADWSGGVNKAASNAPGIGISTDMSQTGDIDHAWTENDQSNAARDPQQTQCIGTAAVNITTEDYENSDTNDTVSLNNTAGVLTWDENEVV